jgi:predicted 3-demethylubiquinone-9 3-methyltransferase (glyoxalase superfamily)
MRGIRTCLWFDGRAEEAALFYTAIFDDSKLGRIARYGEAGAEVSGQKQGTVMTVEFELGGQPFLALNGGPHFAFNEAISFVVSCETQQELDRYWSRLSQGGSEGQCGWLKDKFGVSWQVVPNALGELMGDPDPARSQRVMQAMLRMKKLDIAELRRAREQA